MAKGRSNKPAEQPRSFLASMFAGSASGGIQQAAVAVQSLEKSFSSAAVVAMGFDKVSRTVTANAAALAKAFTNVGPALAAGVLAPLKSLQGMVGAIAGGTQEAEGLDQAMTGLSRTMAGELAPYVRALTTAIQMLTQWWEQLDPTLKRQIALWVAIAAGVAAVAALVPVLVGAVGALVSAFVALFAVIASPFVLVPVLVTAAIAALVALFGIMTTDSKTASEAMGGNLWAWIDVVFDGIKFLGQQFIKFFNWLIENWTALTKKMVSVSESLGVLPAPVAAGAKAMIALVEQMEPAKALHLDENKWNDQLEGMRAKFKEFVKSTIDIGKGLGAGWGKFLELFDKIGKGKGFHVKFDVAIETPQATFDRLMKAFAAKPGGPEQEQVDLLQDAKKLLQDIAKDIGKVGAAVPAVRRGTA